MTNYARWIIRCITLIAVPFPSMVSAQDYCIPEARGVPGLSGPPKWRPDPIANFPDQMKRLDDPRWRGAISHSLNGEVEFRALYRKPDSLYLSWIMKTDGQIDLNADQVLVGVKQGNSKPPVIISLQMVSNAPGEALPPVGGTPDPLKPGGYQWIGHWQIFGDPNDNTAPPIPAWIKKTTRAWTQVSPQGWAFQMVLPITASGLDDGLDIADPFEMWYAVVNVVDAGANTTATPYAWPAVYELVVLPNGSIDVLPNPNLTWSTVRLGNPPGVSCAGDVELTSVQIGTENNPASQIEFTALPDPQNLDTNVFYVRPKNIRSAGALATGSIEAKVFIANW